MALILNMRKDEILIINDCRIRVNENVDLAILDHARFMFGRQIMEAADATTPARALYFMIQTAYVGKNMDIRIRAYDELREMLRRIEKSEGVDFVERVSEAVADDRWYDALKEALAMIKREGAVSCGAEERG